MPPPEPSRAAITAPHQPEEDLTVTHTSGPARRLLKDLQTASKNWSHPNSQLVFTAFYHRYHHYLFKVVYNELNIGFDNDAIQSTVDTALQAFFRLCDRFDPDRAPDDKGCDQLIRAYLGRLAKWKAKKARSFYQSFAAPIVDLDAIHKELEKMGGAPDWARKSPDAAFEKTKAEVVAWVDSLSKVERDVLQTYFLDDHLGRKSERLPDGIAKALADRHQTTTSNIRHKKAKLERLLREKYPNL